MGSTKIAIAGFGTIGRVLARRLQALDDFELVAIASGNRLKAEAAMDLIARPVPIVDPKYLADAAEIVVDCAPTAAFKSIATASLERGRTLVTVSGAAILEHADIIELAKRAGGRIVLATGALLGLDAVRAAALGEIFSVTMITRKPPRSLETAKYVVENRIALDDLKSPLRIFLGTAREGARAFPANVNVAAALALAGGGPDKVQLEIWADPALSRNTHRITVDADSARFELFIENIPTDENPGTGRITALSLLDAVIGLHTPFRVGS